MSGSKKHKIEKKKESINRIKNLGIIFLISGISLFFINLVLVSLFLIFKKIDGLNNLSYIGDYFSGSVGILINISVLFFILSSFLTQAKELKLQREELKQTREIFNAEKKEMEEQTKMFSQQAFENGFFQLFRLFTEQLKDSEYIARKSELVNSYSKLRNKNINSQQKFEYIKAQLDSYKSLDQSLRAMKNMVNFIGNYLLYFDTYEINMQRYIDVFRSYLNQQDRMAFIAMFFHFDLFHESIWKDIFPESEFQTIYERTPNYNFQDFI